MSFGEGFAQGLGASGLSQYILNAPRQQIANEDAQLGLDLKKQSVDRQKAYDDAGRTAWQRWNSEPADAKAVLPMFGGQPQAQAASRDPMDGYLVGMDAMKSKALELGDYDKAAKLFKDSEDLRSTLLQKGLQVADSQFAASGGKDFTPYVDLYNKYWNDGRKIEGIGTRQDGASIVKLVDRDGTSRELVLDKPGQLQQYMNTLRDPTAARMASAARDKFEFEERIKSDAKIREKDAEQRGKVKNEGIKLGPNDKVLFPDASGKVTDASPSVENVTDKYALHGDGQGGMFKLNTRTGDVGTVSGGAPGSGWPAGYKPAEVESLAKDAGNVVLELAKNPINGFDEKAQGAIAKSAARASEIFKTGKGSVDPRRAAQQAIDEAKRSGILAPKKKDDGLPEPLSLTPRGPAGSQGISFTK